MRTSLAVTSMVSLVVRSPPFTCGFESSFPGTFHDQTFDAWSSDRGVGARMDAEGVEAPGTVGVAEVEGGKVQHE